MHFFIQQDLNDNAPVFGESIYRVYVPEDAEYDCKYSYWGALHRTPIQIPAI